MSDRVRHGEGETGMVERLVWDMSETTGYMGVLSATHSLVETLRGCAHHVSR